MLKQTSKLQSAVTLMFLGFVAWWISFQSVVENQSLTVQWFAGTYGLMALIGAFIGFKAAAKWGGRKTVLGKSLIFFSLGLLAQEVGQLTYQYYIYGAKIDIPYPSLGDVAYFSSILLYICAAFFLTKAAGAKFSLNDVKSKALAIVVPLALLVVSYIVLLRNHEYDFGQPLTVFLDFGYPMGQAIYLSIAIMAYLLSRKLLGGVMKQGILLIILALFIQYIADFTFVYQSSRGTYVPGAYDDLFYLVAYFAMATAMIKFLNIYKGLRAGNKPDTEKATEDVK